MSKNRIRHKRMMLQDFGIIWLIIEPANLNNLIVLELA